MDPTNSEERLGTAVRELGKAAGLSQRELAENRGIARQAIADIERGATLPTLRTLERLMVALHLPPSEALRRAEGQTGFDPFPLFDDGLGAPDVNACVRLLMLSR